MLGIRRRLNCFTQTRGMFWPELHHDLPFEVKKTYISISSTVIDNSEKRLKPNNTSVFLPRFRFPLYRFICLVTGDLLRIANES